MAQLRSLLFLLATVLGTSTTFAKNGFDLSNAIIDPDLVAEGGPPRDGIPSIDAPQFDVASDVNWLRPDEFVIGVVHNAVAKAYPVRIMNWHEIVNDKFNGEEVLVTYCPLCGTGIVFIPPHGGDFGVSGLLYNSDVLLYDRASESLWSQILAQAVSGPRVSEKLTIIPSRFTSWQAWQQQWPDTLVLNRLTGHTRDYSRDPYKGYTDTELVFATLANVSERKIHPKERVLGIEIDGVYKAYPFSTLKQHAQAKFTDQVNGETVTIHWEQDAPSAWAQVDEQELPAIDGFWFAWYAFYPQTQVFTPKKNGD